MPPELVVRVIGDTSQLEKSFKRAEKQTRGFGKDMERTGRGAAAATIGFRGLGRAVGFASGAFLGGAGAAAAIKSTIAAAEESQRVLGQTQVAVKRSGLSWEEYGKRIQDVSLATANLSGFDDERLLQTFSNLVRRTGNVNRALELNALAADVARGRNIELESAAQLVLKASLGQAGALRRVGIAAKQGASGIELVDSLQRKFAGSAEAYGKTAAGAQDRFKVALQNTQEVIGNAFLPALTTLLDKASTWLGDTKNQEKLQRNLNTAVRDGAAAFGALADAVGVAADAYDRLNAAAKKLPGVSGIPDIVKRGISQLPGAGIVTGIQALERKGAAPGGDPFTSVMLLVEAAAGQLQQAAAQAVDVVNAPRASPFGADVPRNIDRRRTGLTRGQSTAVALARAQASGDTRAIVAAANARLGFLRDTQRFAEKLIAQHRGNTKQLADTLQSLFGEEASVEGIISGIEDAAAAKAKTARDKREAREKKRDQEAKAAAKRSAQRAADRVAATNKAAVAQIARIAAVGTRLRNQRLSREQAAQFQALGLTATGAERVPTRGNLQAQLQKAEAAVAGGPLDTKAMQKRFDKVRKVLRDGFGKLTVDTRRAVAEWLDALAGKTPGSTADDRQAASIKQLVQGTGLAGAGLRRLEFNLAGAHLTTPVRGGRTTVVHSNLYVDGSLMARNTTEHQERDQRRKVAQTRGREHRR